MVQYVSSAFEVCGQKTEYHGQTGVCQMVKCLSNAPCAIVNRVTSAKASKMYQTIRSKSADKISNPF